MAAAWHADESPRPAVGMQMSRQYASITIRWTTTAAPAPSPNKMQVPRSDQSVIADMTSDPDDQDMARAGSAHTHRPPKAHRQIRNRLRKYRRPRRAARPVVLGPGTRSTARADLLYRSPPESYRDRPARSRRRTAPLVQPLSPDRSMPVPCRNPPLSNPGSLDDPVIGRGDHALQIGIGQHAFRNVYDQCLRFDLSWVQW